jgi:hypothetical protein
MSIKVGGASLGSRPLGPVPEKKDIGFAKTSYIGTSPKLTQNGLNVNIKFSGKAVSGGDLAAFMKVTLPTNSPIPGRPALPPKTVTVNFKNGESAVDQAKQLEAALKKDGGAGYGIKRSGTTVQITERLMM